jgi:tetratricopeptide (TPR) repeat protein
VRSRPRHHPRRAEAVSDLGGALEQFCVYHGEKRPWLRGRRCIELLREGLDLRPPGHPLRDQSLHILARAMIFVRHDDLSTRVKLVTDSISLHRQALRLRPLGHPGRSKSMGSLAELLRELYGLNGDGEALEEAIAICRQVLFMPPPGQVFWDCASQSLMVGLQTWPEHRGAIERLSEAVGLFRETLRLLPPGHQLRYLALHNIAWAIGLSTLFEDKSEQFIHVVSLRREALELLPTAQPQRSRVMANLAESLVKLFREGGSLSGDISEAIDFQRRALHLRRLRDLPLDDHMSSLADALAGRFDLYQVNDDLLEAISLQRQSLQRRPTGHWHRSGTLQKLANLLCRLEYHSCSEALLLYREALELSPSGFPNRALLLSDMSRCFLEPTSPSFDILKGMTVLSEAHSDNFCHVHVRLKAAVPNLRLVEKAYLLYAHDGHRPDEQILELYVEVIGLLPRAANFGLDHSTRLQAIAGSDEIARNAAARAVYLGRVSNAVEMLEEGRGIFWSQTLHLKAVGCDGVPDEDRQELERLLQLLEFGASGAQSAKQTAAQREKEAQSRYQLNVEAEALIMRIRGYPGLGRFLLPASFESLVGALPNGYVVIVNSSKLGTHALVLHKSARIAASLELTSPHTGFNSTSVRAQLPRDASSSSEMVRAMRLDGGRESSLDNVLALLWTSIALPVIRKLGLRVRMTSSLMSLGRPLHCRKQMDMIDPVYGGASLANLDFSPSMRPARIKAAPRTSSQIMLSVHIPQCSRRSPRLDATGRQSHVLNWPVFSFVRSHQTRARPDAFHMRRTKSASCANASIPLACRC